MHAIAIATNYKASHVKKNDDERGGNVSKRILKRISEEEIISEQETLHRSTEQHTSMIPGQGWVKAIFGGHDNNGYCDGTSMSTCARGPKNDCLLYGHNDGHGGKYIKLCFTFSYSGP